MDPRLPTGNSLIFIGVGSSTGTPRLSCLTKTPMKCKVCIDAIKPGSKNLRHNPSILVIYNGKYILFDCGKTFRTTIVNAMKLYHIPTIDAVIITHGHADAFYGLDDLREFCDTGKIIPVYVHSVDMPNVQSAFPYLVDTRKATGSGYVSMLNFITFEASDVLDVFGLKITPLPVEHGINSKSLGFHFGNNVYISDISSMPEETALNLQQLGEIDIFIIDALLMYKENVSHYNLQQAIAELRRWKPKRAYLTGMSHDFDYYSVNQMLKSLLNEPDRLYVEMPYEGLRIHLTC